jgi:hypothetical protein
VASKSLAEWLKILWEKWRVSAGNIASRLLSCVVCVFSSLSSSPAAGEFVSLL